MWLPLSRVLIKQLLVAGGCVSFACRGFLGRGLGSCTHQLAFGHGDDDWLHRVGIVMSSSVAKPVLRATNYITITHPNGTAVYTDQLGRSVTIFFSLQ